MKSVPIITATAVALGLSLAAPARAEDATVKDVSVNIDIDAATGANALTYYPEMADDLKRFIVAELPVSDDPNGYTVQVDVQSVTLNGDTMLPDSREFNRIEGVALVTSPLTNAAPQSIPVQLAAETADSLVPEGYIAVKPDTEDFYIAMLAAFADYVAREVPEYMREDAAK